LFGFSALAGGSQAALNFYQQRVADVFDAIFLPSSTNHQPTELVFNVQQTIAIKYDPKALMNESQSDAAAARNRLD
jgi:homoserine acetyltransferase